jgi:hypothetical protein
MAKKLKLSSFSVNFDEKDKKDFSVKSNMDENTFHAAVVNWAARTIVFTAESFVDYVNSKNSGDYCEVIPEELSLVEKMKPFQEQWQKDMDKTLNPKKETLEEAAEKWYDSTEENIGYPKIKAFIEGAKWQQEQDLITHENVKTDNVFRSLRKVYEHQLSLRYSEEEILNLLWKFYTTSKYMAHFDTKADLIEWFEQFKK